ncbi:MAG: hypothetical protein FWG88_03080 [Oscillospiraceae bacterium]|nr:hypothetical protein [Oscillospiraceae bacterium]
MLMNFDEASKHIESGGLLHIAGTEELLRKLPKGNWVGGSTEYFMTKDGGIVSGDLLFVTEFPYDSFAVKSYDVSDVKNVAADSFDHGFSIVIIPFDSAVHREYAENAAAFQDMFLKDIVGWISGINLGSSSQTPTAVNGITGEVFSDKAVVLHIDVPDDKTIAINIVNIFESDKSSPVITFPESGFTTKNCFIDGIETVFADYIAENNIDTKLPLVADYAGAGVNISFRAIENGIVSFYAPVFESIQYKLAKNLPDYSLAFHKHLEGISDANAVFSCNCILNFMYGELEGKILDAFTGPVTFGEIAYQLVNQTLVYVTVQ